MERTEPRTRAHLSVRRLRARALDGSADVTLDDRITVGSAPGNDLVLADPTVSRFHVELLRSGRGIEVRDLGSTNGVKAGELTIRRGAVAPGTTLTLGAVHIEVLDAGLGELELRRELPGLIAVAPSSRATLARIERAAVTSLSVLLAGESGTGKERFAEALHRLGPRASLPFVVVDCGAIPVSLLASELFGHEKGAFTGAREARVGAFERAAGGTVFLDEIAELGPEAAQLLSGALSRKRFRKVGGAVELPLEARLVSASHAELPRLANEGRFRADLLHLISEVRIGVAPLRERAEEIEPLVDHFLAEAGHRGPRSAVITDARLAALAMHRWPGNVRELRQVVLAELLTGEPVELMAGPPEGPFGELLAAPFREARDATMGRFEHAYLTALLDRSRQNVSEAARIAGIDRTHLHDLLRRHALR
jgi:DNA-binding NtrC family response regulator